jgi:YHS domain-containing protein
MLADGRTTSATAEYLRESILDPATKIVATYPPSMPGYRGQLSDAQVDALVRYIQRLQAPEGAMASTAMAGQGAAVDPVCGMSIHAGPETVHVTHDGRTVYFCSDHCRDRFVANPGAFSR